MASSNKATLLIFLFARNGLECLWRLRKLKTLILRDMDHVRDIKLICLMLLDIFPDLVRGRP